MKDEIKDKIIEKQNELIQHLMGFVYEKWDGSNPYKFLSGCNCKLCIKFGKELISLQSHLSVAGEEKPIIKKCRQCRFFDLDEHCEPCESCYPIAYSNWQPR